MIKNLQWALLIACAIAVVATLLVAWRHETVWVLVDQDNVVLGVFIEKPYHLGEKERQYVRHLPRTDTISYFIGSTLMLYLGDLGGGNTWARCQLLIPESDMEKYSQHRYDKNRLPGCDLLGLAWPFIKVEQ